VRCLTVRQSRVSTREREIMACDRAALSSVLLVTVSFCQAQASCIMLCSMHRCALSLHGTIPVALDTGRPLGAAQRRARYGPRTPRVLPRHADAEPRGALCAERDGGGAIRRRRADPSPPWGHLAPRRLPYRGGRLRAPGR